MNIIKHCLYIVLFLIGNPMNAQQYKKENYAGGYRKLHTDISNSISDILIKTNKHGYFFLLYEIEIKRNKTINVQLHNNDTSKAFIEIEDIIKATEKNWRFLKNKNTFILPVIIHDLRGECFSDKPMFKWFSGDKFKTMPMENSIMIPPLVVGFTIPVK